MLAEQFTHRNILVYEDYERDTPQAEEPEYMPTANRRQWMRDYMKEYRQGNLRGGVAGQRPDSDRREMLKEAHRLDSFKWRLSKLSSPQYEILLCEQYAPEYGIFKKDDSVITHHPEFCNNIKDVLDYFPILEEEFRPHFDIGGSELFKVFLFRKYGRKFNRVTDSVVGVLDKAALLENLQRLPSQGGNKWEKVLNRVEREARQGTWRKLDFSEEPCLWVESYTLCQALKWTSRDRPRWSSSELHRRLYGWALGSRRIGPGERYEWLRARDGYSGRLILSPFLWCDEIYDDEIA